MTSLCETCSYVREVVSGSGSRFLLCELSKQNHRYTKYPPQPIVRCEGFKKLEVKEENTNNRPDQ